LNLLPQNLAGIITRVNAVKLVVYSMTPAFIAGFFRLIPGITIFGFFISLYGIYLLFQGIPKMSSVPEAKKYPYGIVAIVCNFVLMFIMSMFVHAVSPGMMDNQLTLQSPSGATGEQVQLPGGITVDLNEFQKAWIAFRKMPSS
jgi:hypothetical protein